MANSVTLQDQQEGTSSSTVTLQETEDREQEVPKVTLKLRKPKTDRKVQWTTETVDNEHMNKKKSKCCCIYAKPKKFGESSDDDSDDDDEEECDHCHGHVEKTKKKSMSSTGDRVDRGGPSCEDKNCP